jgi:hypothetical protein
VNELTTPTTYQGRSQLAIHSSTAPDSPNPGTMWINHKAGECRVWTGAEWALSSVIGTKMLTQPAIDDNAPKGTPKAKPALKPDRDRPQTCSEDAW